jgi:CRISPR-associated protein Csb2
MGALVFTIRYAEGRYHGAGDWPPAPGRLFQALVAGSARGSELPDAAQAALRWLEAQAPPIIAAPRTVMGQTYTNYVPNNDLDRELTKRKHGGRLEKATAAIRAGKQIAPRLFNADHPLLYIWSMAAEDDTPAQAAVSLAPGLFQLGRGGDMAWAAAKVVDDDAASDMLQVYPGVVYRPGPSAGSAFACPTAGTLDSLIARFAANRRRFTRAEKTTVFTQPPKALMRPIAYDSAPWRALYDVRTPDGSFYPLPETGAVAFVRTVRDQIAQRLRLGIDPDSPIGRDIDRFVIGKDATARDTAARLRLIPLPSIGHDHATRSIRRLAVELPAACHIPVSEIARALSGVCSANQNGEIIVDAKGEVVWELKLSGDNAMLDHHYTPASSLWRSVTPLALPAARRRIDPTRSREEAKGPTERCAEELAARRAVFDALRHASAPARPVEIKVQREPFHPRGDRAEAFAADRFAKERLWHVELRFAEPVAGPLLLADGRFMGLGLMAPERASAAGVAFRIIDGLAPGAEPLNVARALRRAMMARVRQHLRLRPGGVIPKWFTGHGDDGGPSQDLDHGHVYVWADLENKLIGVFAPHLVHNRAATWEATQNSSVLEAALSGLDTLRAGASGLLIVMREHVEPPSSTVWQTCTPYVVRRHVAAESASAALAQDCRAALREMGRPSARIDVLSVMSAPRLPLSGMLRLTFATAQTGPVLLGRTAHQGGGLFTAVG